MDPEDLKVAVENFKLLEVIGGSYNKTVLDCEVTPRREARRSIVINNNLKKGDIIKKEDIMLKRPGTGIKPEHIEIVIGRPVKIDIEQDTVLTWDMI